MDQATWEIVGIVVMIVGQFGQFMHISNVMEKRFTALEIHVEYLRKAVNQVPIKRLGDLNSD